MARRTSLVSLNQMSDINMTPLMDLTFILLITFIITFPLIEQGIAINLPKGKSTNMTEQKTRSISLKLDGGLYFDNVIVSREELAAKVADMVITDPSATVYVRADRKLLYGDVVEVMKILNEANVTKMALVTQAE